MHDYLFSSEIVRFAFVFGICVSMMLYERLHLTTGSIVVPGYIAVFLVYPMVVIATFANALLSYAIMNHFLRKHFMLYGRTKFTLMALISISIQTLMLKLSPSGPWLWENNIPLFVGAGYVVPALIAHDMGRQGIKRTSKAVLLAGVIVALPIALALVLQLKGVNDLAPLAGFGTMSIANRWIPLAVLLSAASSWGVAHNYSLKAGGFVGAAYVGMFMGDPYQVAVAFTIALFTYVLVKYVLMNVLILFGRRKFSAMLLTSSMLSWTLLWAGPVVPQLPRHQSPRPRVDGADAAVRARAAGQRHGPHQPDPGGRRRRPGGRVRRAGDVVDPGAGRRPVAGTAVDAVAIATFVVIFWKSMRQLYRHYRPVKEVGRRSRRRLLVRAGVRRARAGLRRRLRAGVRGGVRHRVGVRLRLRRGVRARVPGDGRGRGHWRGRPGRRSNDARPAGRGAIGPQRTVPAAAPDVDWTDLVPNVVLDRLVGLEPKGNKRWQDAHPDAWEDADRWLADALSPHETATPESPEPSR